MRKNIKSITFLTIIFATIIIPVTIQAGTIYYFSPYPQGTIGISKPEIGWKIYLEGNEVEYANFTLNGKPIEGFYDHTSETFLVKLDRDLSGTNKVTAKIQLKSWSNQLEQTWSFTVASNSISSLPLPNSTQMSALNYANGYRYILGHPLYLFDNSLNMAAKKHADYQSVNTFGHYQVSGKTGFFGESVMDRANYYGFFGVVSEDISYQSNPSVQEAVDSLFDAPYHRIPFLRQELNYFGYGKNSYYHVLNFGGKVRPETKFVAYPTANQLNVPIAWVNYETPNPLRFYAGAPKKVGYPIMAGVYGANIENVQLRYAKLWDQYSNEVPIYTNAPKNDNELTQEVILIPKSPLKLSQQYKVRMIVDATVDSKPVTYDKTWYFTTEKVEGQGRNLIHQQVNYPPFMQNVDNIQFLVGQRFMYVDQEVFSLDSGAYMTNNRTMVPIRALGNSLGAIVNWDANRQTVVYKKDTKTIELPVNKNYIKVNGSIIYTDQGAILKGSRSFVPIRIVSEQFGAKVNWDQVKQEVLIVPNY